LNVAPEPLHAPPKSSVHIPESGEHEAEELKKQTKQAGKEVKKTAEQAGEEAKKTGKQAGEEVKKTAEQAEKKGKEFASQAEKKGKELASEAEKKGKEFSKKAKVCISLDRSCDVTDWCRRNSRRSSLSSVHTGRRQRTLSSDPVLLVV
jgi:ParB-like chromosome segregation protein Spo0J